MPHLFTEGGARKCLTATFGSLVSGEGRAYPATEAAQRHAFLNDAPSGPRALRPLLRATGMGPRPEQAAEAWSRIEAFFAKYL